MDINEKLINSIRKQDLESVKECLKNGADANTRDIETNSALSWAIAIKPNFEIIKLLIEHGADVNAKTRLIANNCRLEYPIVQIARERELTDKNNKEENEKIMKYLIANGANVNLYDSDGTTALQWICHLDKNKNPLEIAKYLIEQGANVNPQHSHPTLSWAISRNNYDINLIKYLIEHGADVNAKDKNGKTPLMCAAHKHNIAKLLIDNGADVNARDNTGHTALIYAAKGVGVNDYYLNNCQIMKLLIDNGADVNAKTDFDFTALHYAVSSGNSIENIKFLIDNGADVNAKDYRRQTPLEEYKENKLLILNDAIISLLQSKMQIKPKIKAKSKSNDFGISM